MAAEQIVDFVDLLQEPASIEAICGTGGFVKLSMRCCRVRDERHSACIAVRAAMLSSSVVDGAGVGETQASRPSPISVAMNAHLADAVFLRGGELLEKEHPAREQYFIGTDDAELFVHSSWDDVRSLARIAPRSR